MPFIKPEKRIQCDKDFRLAEDKGDLCYLIYKDLTAIWNKDPRWTTVHNLYKEKVIDTFWLQKFRGNDRYTHQDAITALHLAWQVFFAEYVLPYEHVKKSENGDVL